MIDRWDALERVRVDLVFRDGTKGSSEPMTRREAEGWFDSATWHAAPISNGKPVQAAAIKRVFE